MIEAHFLRELFVEGVSVKVNDFVVIVWESLMKKNHRFHFEYYLGMTTITISIETSCNHIKNTF